MKKEYMVLTHGNLELLEKQVNEALEHGWNLLEGPKYLSGQWVQAITRVTGESSVDEWVQASTRVKRDD